MCTLFSDVVNIFQSRFVGLGESDSMKTVCHLNKKGTPYLICAKHNCTFLCFRPNIFLGFKGNSSMQYEEELQWLVDDVRDHQMETEKTIIYSPFINSGTDIFIYFCSQLKDKAYVKGKRDFSSRFIMQYHSKSGKGTKEYVQSEFSKPDSHIRMLISTIAFGMGME